MKRTFKITIEAIDNPVDIYSENFKNWDSYYIKEEVKKRQQLLPASAKIIRTDSFDCEDVLSEISSSLSREEEKDFKMSVTDYTDRESIITSFSCPNCNETLLVHVEDKVNTSSLKGILVPVFPKYCLHCGQKLKKPKEECYV